MDGSHFEALAKTFIPRATRAADSRADDHWFDTLNKMLVRDIPRRTIQRAAGMAIASIALGAVPFTEAAKNRKMRKNKNKKRNKDKGKDKPTPPPDPAQTCSGGACRSAWPSDSQYDTDNRDYCEFVCQQCDGDDPREFCIIGDQVADCCDDGLKCCDDFCVNTWEDDNHCGACNNPCSPGKVCFGGDCLCREGLTLCGNICRDTNRDENNCGGCDQPCTGTGMQCCDGDCVDVTKFDNAHCGSCLPCATAEECCYGVCLDPQQITCCRDRPGPYWRTCPVPEVCSEQPCTPNGGIYCCPP